MTKLLLLIIKPQIKRAKLGRGKGKRRTGGRGKRGRGGKHFPSKAAVQLMHNNEDSSRGSL